MDAEEPSDAQLDRARRACADRVLETPLIESDVFSDIFGRRVLLKAENLQRTGSFKLRGATAKIAALGPQARKGVVAGSAGNHGRAVALAAHAAGVPCEVFMPESAAITKVEATRALGAEVRCEWETVDEAVAAAAEHAMRSGRAFLHPFDDLDVIAGQATLGDELVREVPDLATVVVPLGGGGLASGIGIALDRAGCHAQVVAVQASACAPFRDSLEHHAPLSVEGHATIADGIAVRTPGHFTLPLVSRYVDQVTAVDDDDIAEAVVRLFESAKLVVEGAGAVGVAALLRGAVDLDRAAREGALVVVLSGGNIDPGVFGDAIRRHEVKVGRRLVFVARIDDRPGALVGLLTGIAQLGANVLDITHQREGIELPFGTTAVQLVVQTRDRAHGDAVVDWTKAAGFDIARVFGGGRSI
jgi:threonine dehydratase